jgi:hypothetical protein
MKRNMMKAVVLAIVLVIVLAVSVAVVLAGAQVTQGDFHTYASGSSLGYDISGHAQMERVPSGKTIVKVHIAGLQPGVTYPVHVHNQPCNVDNGGGHYQHEVSGPVDAVNEIWPGFTTNNAGVGNGKATHAHIARPEAQSIVVHDPNASGARIACADLE